MPPAKLLLIHKAILAACDARDGVKDGLLEDPRLCDFDPKILECKGEDGPNCNGHSRACLNLVATGCAVCTTSQPDVITSVCVLYSKILENFTRIILTAMR